MKAGVSAASDSHTEPLVATHHRRVNGQYLWMIGV
jgi:hypothetical protein